MKVMKARSLVLLLGLFACSPSVAGVTGVWTGHATDPGGNSQDLTVNLKADGNRLTGTVVGPPPLDSALSIENGKIAEEIGLDDGVTALQQLGILKAA